jgi:hypothetical protein
MENLVLTLELFSPIISKRSARSRAIRKFLTLLALIGMFPALTSPSLAATNTAPLLQKANLVYEGAFRVPRGSSDTTTFCYGGTSLAFNAQNTSLFMVGHDWYQYSAEINIPKITNSPNIENLATATMLQQFQDTTEGKLNNVNPSDPNAKKVGGHLVYENNLYVTVYSYFDGSGTQSSSHFKRSLSLSTKGQVAGPYRVGAQYPGFVSGYMTQIPPEWQSQFEAPALTGNCCLAIAGIQSNGPAASVFNPADIGTLSPVPATPVVGYPAEHPLGTGWETTSTLYNGTTRIRGIVFPSGTRSVLFFGRQGIGPFCYGTPSECNDPTDDSKGCHAYPYRYQIWAYDANDLLSVKNRTKQPWTVQPYAVWDFDLPFANNYGQRVIGGAAYDPKTNQIYLSQQCTDTNCAPIVHVFRVLGATDPNITPPSNLRVQ